LSDSTASLVRRLTTFQADILGFCEYVLGVTELLDINENNIGIAGLNGRTV